MGFTSYTFVVAGMVGAGWYKDWRYAIALLIAAVPLCQLVGAPAGPIAIAATPVARFLLAAGTGLVACYLIETTRRARRDAMQVAEQQSQLDEIAAREGHLRAMTDALPMIMASIDREERVRANNRAYEIWFGPNRRDVRGLHVKEVIGDEAYAIVGPYVRQALSGKSVKFEALVPYNDAGPRWVEATCLPDVGANGDVRGYFAFVRDRTERVQAEAVLRLSERRYRALVEASASVVWVVDPGARVMQAQPDWERYTGQVWPDYHLVANAAAAVHPDDRQALTEKWQAARTSLTPLVFTGRIWHADSQSWRHCENIAIPVKSDKGEVIEWIGTTTDVEDRVLAPVLDQLRLSDERTRLAESAARLGTWEWDLGSGFVWSEGLARLYGLDPLDCPSYKPFIDLVASEDRHRVREAFRLAARDEGGVDIECRIVRADGEVRWVHARGSFLGATTQHAARIVGVTIDITESVETREALAGALTASCDTAADLRETAEDPRHANAAKDEFLGMASHELRTPLTIIKGDAAVLRRLGEQVEAEVRATVLEDIDLESTRLQWLIENMLVLARLERGQHLELEPVLMSRIVQGVIDEQRRERPGRCIRLFSQDADEPILAYAEYLEQVVTNLVSNADKYSPTEAPIEISVERADGEVRVHVLDRGVGIVPGEEDRIFEPFYRSERTSSRAGGMGLGLAVCKRVIEAQRGRLWARPRSGGGSDFGFALPAS